MPREPSPTATNLFGHIRPDRRQRSAGTPPGRRYASAAQIDFEVRSAQES